MSIIQGNSSSNVFKYIKRICDASLFGMGERLCSEDFVRPESTTGVVFGGLFTVHQMGVKVFLLKRVIP